MMKRLVFLFLALFFLFLPRNIHADEGWLIENFHSDIAMQQSGDVRIVETIAVDFKNQSKHGIYRDIPYLYEANGQQTYTEVIIENVLQNNTQAKYTTKQTNGYQEVKIGDPNKTITGRNVYTITYTARGILRGLSDHDELYWNVTGNNWTVPIQRADATVTLAKEGIKKITCFEGASGSQTACKSNFASPQVSTFTTSKSLAASEGLTIAVAYNKGLIPLVIVEGPKTFWEKLIEWPSLTTILVVIVAGLGTIGYFWYRYGRDYWFAGNLFGTKDEKGNLKPIGGHETISVEFTSPEKLRPAEIGVLIDERADTLDVTATIIDLATRGYLKIAELPKKWMFGKVDYQLTRTMPKVRRKQITLLAYEQLLLDKLFAGGMSVKVSTLKKTFYDELREVKQALYKEVVTKSLFPTDPEKVRGKYLIIAFIILICGIGVFFLSISKEIIVLGDLGIGAAVVGLVFLFMVGVMPRRTAYGRDLYRRAKGYRLFVDKAEKYRQQYFERQNMFNEVLPYAIVFGLTKKFAKQMREMGLEPKQTDWYASSHAFSTGVFVSHIDAFSQSLSTAIATTPSSSGGFSGGSSGGGFGGGGGGSW